MWRHWEDLPLQFQIDEVRPYYEVLERRRFSLILKRGFDVVFSLLGLVVFSPLLLVVGVLIILDSKGGAFFTQERITQYGRPFRIHKFRTMVKNAEQLGTQVAVADDARITRVGKFLRKYRLDELPQFYDILVGNMTFVGTRPETPCYVASYTPEMYATLLLPAGVTSEASIEYKDENELLNKADDIDKVYVNVILPAKMRYNLDSVRNFSLLREFVTLIKTVQAVFR